MKQIVITMVIELVTIAIHRATLRWRRTVYVDDDLFIKARRLHAYVCLSDVTTCRGRHDG